MLDNCWVDDPKNKPYIRSLAQQEREIRAILARDFSARLLNNTKWRELMASLDELPLSYRIKFVDVPAPLEGWLSHQTDKFYDSPWGPVPILCVEWLEILNEQKIIRGQLLAPETISHACEVQRRLSELNIPYQLLPDCIRITAHLRKAQAMPAAL
jgi:hypothetical protein